MNNNLTKIYQLILVFFFTDICAGTEAPNLDNLSNNLLYKIVNEIPRAERVDYYRKRNWESMSFFDGVEGEDIHSYGIERNVRGPLYRFEASKSLRLVNRSLAFLLSNELSPLGISLKGPDALNNPSSYFPLYVKFFYNYKPTAQHIRHLIENQPNICSLYFWDCHLPLSLFVPLNNLQILVVRIGDITALRECRVRSLGINPQLKILSRLKPGELGVYLKSEYPHKHYNIGKIYCKTLDKEEIEIDADIRYITGGLGSAFPANRGMRSEDFYKLIGAIKGNPEDCILTDDYIKDLLGSTDSKGYTSSIDSIKQFKNLRTLVINTSNLEALPNLSTLSNLEKLDVSYNSLTNIESFVGLENLTYLNLGNNRNLRFIEPLSSLRSLKILDLNGTSLYGLEPLSHLNSLICLNLGNNRGGFQNLGPLSSLTALKSLYLRSKAVSAYDPLTSLQQLTFLDLSKASTFSTFSPLSKLTNLESLDLDLAEVDNYSFLLPLVNLKELIIEEEGRVDIQDIITLFLRHKKPLVFSSFRISMMMSVIKNSPRQGIRKKRKDESCSQERL